MLNLTNKRYVVFGVANEKSICWSIAKYLLDCNAEVALVVHPRMFDRVQKLVEKHMAQQNGDTSLVRTIVTCDVAKDGEVARCFSELAAEAPFDGVVHGIAYSDPDELKGSLLDTSRENFRDTLEISCYSLIDITRHAVEMMPSGSSIVTLSFAAAQHPCPNYNVMGIAKAALEAAMRGIALELGSKNIRAFAISASPENTVSARGVGNAYYIGRFAEAMSPMGRRATLDEIAYVTAFFLSPLSSGMTGRTEFVDCGSSVPLMPPEEHTSNLAKAMADVAADPSRQKNR